MNYNISKLADINPNLATELKNKCYDVVGLCQQVHKEMGPFLNEYMYQEALDILFEEEGIEEFECKAIEQLGPEQRQQLWNYMRLSGVSIGILFNFAPVRDQCERYYLDKNTGNMYVS